MVPLMSKGTKNFCTFSDGSILHLDQNWKQAVSLQFIESWELLLEMQMVYFKIDLVLSIRICLLIRSLFRRKAAFLKMGRLKLT